MNLTQALKDRDNATAYDLRNPDKPFKGLLVPFGCSCTFVRPKAEQTAAEKPSPNGTAAIFVGYYEVGGVMDGSYLVIELQTFLTKPLPSGSEDPKMSVSLQRLLSLCASSEIRSRP